MLKWWKNLHVEEKKLLAIEAVIILDMIVLAYFIWRM